MNIKSAQDVIEVVRSRGLLIIVNAGPPPMPVIRVPIGVKRAEATPALMTALRAWRLEIIDLLKPTAEEIEKTKRLQLKYADGDTQWADESSRLNEKPISCRHADEAEWTPISEDC